MQVNQCRWIPDDTYWFQLSTITGTNMCIRYSTDLIAHWCPKWKYETNFGPQFSLRNLTKFVVQMQMNMRTTYSQWNLHIRQLTIVQLRYVFIATWERDGHSHCGCVAEVFLWMQAISWLNWLPDSVQWRDVGRLAANQFQAQLEKDSNIHPRMILVYDNNSLTLVGCLEGMAKVIRLVPHHEKTVISLWQPNVRDLTQTDN